MKTTSRPSYVQLARAESTTATGERIVEAALALVLERPYEEVTLAAIANAAGVSHQTVLNHFDSKEGVAAAAAKVLAQQTGTARGKARAGDVAGAIEILVREYERFGDANARWAFESNRLGSLAPLLNEARSRHQQWLEQICSDRLPKTATARHRALCALHAATDVYTWKLLRRDLRLDRSETERIMNDLVEGILHSRDRDPRETKFRRSTR